MPGDDEAEGHRLHDVDGDGGGQHEQQPDVGPGEPGVVESAHPNAGRRRRDSATGAGRARRTSPPGRPGSGPCRPSSARPRPSRELVVHVRGRRGTSEGAAPRRRSPPQCRPRTPQDGGTSRPQVQPVPSAASYGRDVLAARKGRVMPRLWGFLPRKRSRRTAPVLSKEERPQVSVARIRASGADTHGAGQGETPAFVSSMASSVAYVVTERHRFSGTANGATRLLNQTPR